MVNNDIEGTTVITHSYSFYKSYHSCMMCVCEEMIHFQSTLFLVTDLSSLIFWPLQVGVNFLHCSMKRKTKINIH